MFKQWKKGQVWPSFVCCTADSQTDAGRHQLYNNNGSLVLFSSACLWLSRAPWDGESTDAAGEGDDRVAVAVERSIRVPGRVRTQALEDAGVEGHRGRGLLVCDSYKRSMALWT